MTETLARTEDPNTASGAYVKPHGHRLLESLLPGIADEVARGHLVEIGSTREKLKGQGSTVVLAKLARKVGLPFVTVDMDPANTAQATTDLVAIRHARAVTARGEDFLGSFRGPIVAAYLDAFDIQHGRHSEYRIDRYRRFLGTEITDAGSAAMHLECARALIPRVVPGGLVVIDDTWAEGDGYAGKGRAAVPELLANGFRIIDRIDTAIALRKEPGPVPALRLLRRAARRASKAMRQPGKLLRSAGRIWGRAGAAFREARHERMLSLTYRFSREGRRSRRALEALRGTAAGRRCVIIGNGPSLNQLDLSVLQDEPTFGLNRGYLLFERMGGPTTYLVSVNRYVLEQSTDEMLESPCPKFFNWRHRESVPQGRDDVIFLHTTHRPGFSTDIVGQGLWEGATVTFVAMQLAHHIGYLEVVLIGVDHSFTTNGQAHRLVTSSGDDQDHFDPRYFGAGYRWQLPDLEMSERAYTMARTAFDRSGGSIVDATLGGKLTVFPKVAFEALFPAEETAPRPTDAVPLHASSGRD